MNKRIENVALLYGGRSSEREISLSTGKNIGNALEELGYNVTYIDPIKKENLSILLKKDFDVVFLALHGKGGEDGTIQGFLETINLPYTGSGVKASAIAINKATTKQVYENNPVYKLPTSPYLIINKDVDVRLQDIVNKIGEECVIKASSEGSSIGLYRAKNKQEIKEYINKALKYDEEVVVEKLIKGREFSVPAFCFNKDELSKYKSKVEVVNEKYCGFPVIEIIPKNEFYDYSSKYDKGGSVHVCPAEIDENIAKKMRQYAAIAHMVLGCRGVSRTDMMLDENNQIWLLETNTLPGMTTTSLVPDSASKIGINFSEICELLIKDAINR